MGMLEDVIKALERIPLWKKVSALPDQVEALERRLKALEQRLDGTAGDLCPKCKLLTLELTGSGPLKPTGPMSLVKIQRYRCSSCGFEDQKTVTP